MLNAIVQFSLRFRGVVVALACLLTGYGLFVAYHSKLDVFPNFVPPQVTVQTEAPGLSPEQVEALVTRPVENTINGLGNLASLRSESIPGLSAITVVFKEGADIFVSRQMLAERLGELSGTLPLGVKAPVMSALMSSTMDLLKIGLTSEKLSPMELRTFADWTLKPRLLSVPGVAHCIVFGGEVRQIQIQVRPDRLLAYGVAISDVLAAAKASTGVIGAGFIENANQRILLQTDGQLLTPETIGDVVVVQREGRSVRLKDLAVVRNAPEPRLGDALVQGQPGILLSLASQYGANTMEATLAVEAALAELKPVFEREQVKVHPRLHRPATFIEASLGNIKHSLFLGGALVGIVLFLFLGHFRTAFISLTAIPLSLLTAVILLQKFGVTLNTITLGGLAIAIGEVVDDAIIDVENIFRRLRENQNLAQPRSVFRVVLDASLEVRTAVVYATFIVALVFLPVLTLTGLQGSFFAPLALSYILAILASLAVALTLTPALSLMFFARGVRDSGEPRIQRWIKRAYTAILRVLATSPEIVVAGVLAVCVGSLAVLPHFGTEFLPEFREGHFVLQIQSVPGTSLAEMTRIGEDLTQKLRVLSTNIESIEMQVGRAEQGEDTWGSHRCEFHVELREHVPGEVQEKLMKDLRAMLEEFPGIQAEVLTFLGDRISETISGETAPVVINVFGDSLDIIDEKASEIAQVLNSIPGAKDVQVKAPPGGPRLAIKLHPEKLNRFGFRAVEVLETIQTAYAGSVVAQVHEGNRVSDVEVILEDSYRGDPEGVGSLMIRNPQGMTLPLRELAEVNLTSGRYSIMHEGATRRQIVTCAPEGIDVSTLVEKAKLAVATKIALPKGVYIHFTGTAEATAAAQHELLLNSAIAAAGILLLLVVVTGNWRNLLLIVANVPFALVGGILFAYLAKYLDEPGEGGLTIGSLVGFVTLFGITTRNSIMMISHYEHLVQHEGAEWNLETAIRGASERLIPILMTAVVTALGLLPLAMGSNEAGREIEGPMAIVILGGLITSTALNLLVLPTLSLHFGQFTKAAMRAEE